MGRSRHPRSCWRKLAAEKKSARTGGTFKGYRAGHRHSPCKKPSGRSKSMKNRILALVLALGLLFTIAPVGQAAVVYHRTTRYSRARRARYVRHKRNMRTV